MDLRASTESAPLYCYRFGNAAFDEARCELRIDGAAVALEQRPLQVLALLLRHADEVVTREELFESVWAGRPTVDNVLANAVAKLRKAMGEPGAERIQTLPRIGYRLVGPVERVSAGRRLSNRLELAPGQTVPGRPHFQLESQLSGSAAAEVWLARHSKTGELRVYKFTAAGERLASLKREATIFRVLREALGDDAACVRIIDWNFEALPFFLECEYGGPSLERWAADGGLAALSQAQRLQLFLRLADAVAAAHGVGVLHKDLKPSNVLIAEEASGWQLRLADFGSSRLLDPAQLEALGITALGMTVTQGDSDTSGTLLYLAPELLGGQSPTVRSDIYALGVMLYQLLVGDFRRQMASGWQRDLGGGMLCEDIARATDGDPASRFGSVTEFAGHLRALDARRAERLRIDQIEQRARLASEALSRARARRPWVTATIVALFCGLLLSLGLYAYATRAQQRAASETLRAEAINRFLFELMNGADPRQSETGPEISLSAALQRALASVDQRFADAPETAAAIHRFAGEIYSGRGDLSAAEQHLRRARQVLEAQVGADGAGTLEAGYRMARLLADRSQHAEAQALITDLDARAGTRTDTDPELALAAHWARGRTLLLQARGGEALPYYEAALTDHQRATPDDRYAGFALKLDLAQCYSRLGRHDEAIALLTELQSPAYADAGISASRRAVATLFLGAATLYAGRPAEAEPLLLRAVDELSRAYGSDSINVMEARGTLGNLYASTGRWQQALPLLQQVREQSCARLGAQHLNCLVSLGNESIVRLQLGEHGAAIAGLRKVRGGFAEAMGEGTPGVQAMDFYLATAALEQGDVDTAGAMLAPLDAQVLEAGSPGEYWDARLRGVKAQLLVRQGQVEAGQQQLRDAIADLQAQQAPDWFVAPLRGHLQASAPGLSSR